jgi:hypothetical protein
MTNYDIKQLRAILSEYRNIPYMRRGYSDETIAHLLQVLADSESKYDLDPWGDCA